MSLSPSITKLTIDYDDGSTIQVNAKSKNSLREIMRSCLATLEEGDKQQDTLDAKQGKRSTRLTAEEVRRYKTENRCFRCGQVDHTARDNRFYPHETLNETERLYQEFRKLLEQERRPARIDSRLDIPNKDESETETPGQITLMVEEGRGGARRKQRREAQEAEEAKHMNSIKKPSEL